jgi:hypothetical protein
LLDAAQYGHLRVPGVDSLPMARWNQDKIGITSCLTQQLYEVCIEANYT